MLLAALLSSSASSADPAAAWVPLSPDRLGQIQQLLTRSLCLRPDVEGIGVVSQSLNLPETADLEVSSQWSNARDFNGRPLSIRQVGSAVGGDMRWSAAAEVQGAVARVDLVLTLRTPAEADVVLFSCRDKGKRKQGKGVEVVLTECSDGDFSLRQRGSNQFPLMHSFGRSGSHLPLDTCFGQATNVATDAKPSVPNLELGCTVQTGCGPGCEDPPDPLASVLWVHPRRWEATTASVTVTRHCDENRSKPVRGRHR